MIGFFLGIAFMGVAYNVATTLLDNTNHTVKLEDGTTLNFKEYGRVTINGEDWDFVRKKCTARLFDTERAVVEPFSFDRILPAEIGRVADQAAKGMNQYIRENKLEELPNWFEASRDFFMVQAQLYADHANAAAPSPTPAS